MFGKSYKGFYKNNYVRSFNEFLYAMYLDLIEKRNFLTENIVLYDIEGKKKIPDFIILDENNKIIEYIELKPTSEENERLICEYVNRKIDLKGIKIRFVHYSKEIKKHLTNSIVEKIGIKEFNRITTEFKTASPKIQVQSFPGELNGMHGKVHSSETRLLIGKSCARPGELNGMHGRTHTKEVREDISKKSKWKNPTDKKKMQQKGMINHFSKIAESEQRKILAKYMSDILNNIKCIRPNFINRAYTLKIDKIVDLFGSIDAFKVKMKELNYG
jgi:hypothetical protein